MKANRRATAVPVFLALACAFVLSTQARALDPGTVNLRVTQVQKLVDDSYQVTLQWNSLSGATYQVQGQDGLGPTGWLDFGLVTPSGATGQWMGNIAAGLVDQGRFFMRLVLPQPKIFSLEPAFVSTGGGVFYILGQCFSLGDRVFVNGVEASAVVFEDHTLLRVTVGAMAAGVYDVEVRDSGGVTVLALLAHSLSVTATGRGDELPPVHPLVNAPGGRGGAGVRAATGELVLSGVDLVVPGRGPSFVWARTYRSKAGPSTAQGEGWDFSYNVSATQSGMNVVVRDGEGRADTFFRQSDGTYARTEFFRHGTVAGTVFTLTFADKGTWRFRAFDAPLAAGKIDRITDRNGNHLDFGYDGAGRLQTVIDTLSKSYTVAYNGAGLIASVTDFSGRAVTYGYDAAGDLLTVTSPPVTGTPTGNDFPAGKTVTYGYSSGFADARLNHNLLTVTDALGQLVQTFTYAPTLVPTDLDFDCCVRYTCDAGAPQPQEQVLFYYGPLNPTPANRFATTLTVVNDHGDVSEVYSDSRNRPLEVRDYTGRSPIGVTVTDLTNRPTGQLRAGDPPYFVTAMEWNNDSLPATIMLPRGAMIENTFQRDFDVTVNLDPRESGNLRVQVTTAAPAVPSDVTTITQSWVYLPGFGTVEGGAPPPGGRMCTVKDIYDSAVQGKLGSSGVTSGGGWIYFPAWNNPLSGSGIGVTGPSIGGGINVTGGLIIGEDPFGQSEGPTIILPPFDVGGAKSPGLGTSWNDPTLGGQNRAWLMGDGFLRVGSFGGWSATTVGAGDECILMHANLGGSGPATPSDARLLLVDPSNTLWTGGLTATQGLAPGGAGGFPAGSATNSMPGMLGLMLSLQEITRMMIGVGLTGGLSPVALRTSSTPEPKSSSSCAEAGLSAGRDYYRAPQPQWTQYVDPQGNIWSSGYDANGNQLLIDPPVAGTEHTWEYNGFGQPTVHIWPQNANGSSRRDEFNYYNAGPQLGWPQSCVVDATGAALATTFEYNAVGVVVRTVDPRGRDTLITPNALNQPVRIASREASAGVRYETDIRYDANNNVTSVDVQNKDETGAVVVANPYFTTQYQYDALNRPIRVIREVDTATTITEERAIDANNHTVTFRSGEAVAGTQPLNTVRVTADERGLPFQVTLAPTAPGQSTTQYDYDLDGNIATVGFGMEVVPQFWFFEWDGLPRPGKIEALTIKQKVTENATGEMRDYEQEPTSVETPNLVITLAESHSKPLYDWQEDFIIGTGLGDGDSCLRSITDPMGNATTYTYDANGNRTKARVDGEHSDVNGGAGNVRLAESRWIYDLVNRPTTWTGLLIDPLGAQTGSVSRGVTWAPNSQPSTVTDERGKVTTYAYDSVNRPSLTTDPKANTRAFGYDANGNLLTITATDKSDLGNPNQVFVVTCTYDGLDRPLTTADNVGNTTQLRYDSRSNLVLVTDARNIQTRFVYDGLRRPLSTARDMDNDGASAADPQDIVIARTWDRNSRLATTTNANGFVTTRNYDALNRPTGANEADGTTSSVVYDVHHNVTQSQDANGTVITRTYDALNRLVGANIAPGAGVAATTNSEMLGYDGLSRLKSANANGSAPTSVSRTYDSLSRLLTETQGALAFACARDAAGNVTALNYPGGNVVTTTYDSLNRPLVVTDSVSGAIITNDYIGPDRIERQTHGNGTMTMYQYDGVQGVANPPGDLGWRQVRAKIVTGPGGAPVHDSRQFFFDANQNRIKRINVPVNLVHTHALDNADRLVNTVVQQGGPPTRNSVYLLDKEGNRLNVSGTGDPHPGVYQMNPALPNPGDAQMNQYTLAPTGAFTYDANGSRQNATSGGTTLQHVYDFAGRLVAINNLTTAQPAAIYAYDSFGRRVQKTTFPGGVPTTTKFVFAGGGIIEERDSGGSVTATSYGDGRLMGESEIWWFSVAPSAVKRTGVMQTLHSDDRNNIMLITSATGLPAERYDYQDFGEPQFFTAAYTPQTGSLLGNPILFRLWRYDTESGNYNTGGGGRAGRVSVSDISITKTTDKASTKLEQAVLSGKANKPDIVVRKSGEKPEEYFDPKIGGFIAR